MDFSKRRNKRECFREKRQLKERVVVNCHYAGRSKEREVLTINFLDRLIVSLILELLKCENVTEN